MMLAEKELRYTCHELTEKGLELCRFRIFTLGMGSAGNPILDRLMSLKVSGPEYIAVNADITHPEAIHEIESHLEEVGTTFIFEEVGGSNGTGEAPTIAEICKKKGTIVIGAAIIPSRFEKGGKGLALQALIEMKMVADTIVIVDDNKLMDLMPQPINSAFTPVDEILANMFKGIAETITLPSLNFADFRTMMEHGDLAIVGIGESDGPSRTEKAAEEAMSHLLFDVDYKDANGALIHIAGGEDLTLDEAVRAAEIITEMLDEKALVIWGARVDPLLGNRLKITIILTGIQASQILSEYWFPEMKLFNLEPYAGPEKPLRIDLNLYQMEAEEK